MAPKPAQVARNSHVASLIRKALEDNQWTVADLCRKLGLAPTSTMPYPWINATAAPKSEIRKKLAALLEVPESELMPSDQSEPSKQALIVVPKKPANLAAHALVSGQQVRITMDQTVSIEQAAEIFAILRKP